MGEETGILWTGSTFNPWIGCTKVSEGCKFCYAEHSRPVLAMRIGWGAGKPRHRTSEALWRGPVRWNKTAEKLGIRHRVFCASLADWLDAEVPVAWLRDLLFLIWRTPMLDWQLLTKRPQNWRDRLCAAMECEDALWLAGKSPRSDFSIWLGRWIEAATPFRGMGSIPHNVWIGVSVENQTRADERIPQLLEIPARRRFLSMEPLLGAIDLLALSPRIGTGVDWVIVGGESGVGSRPCELKWMRSILAQCREIGADCFMKQVGSRTIFEPGEQPTCIRHPKGGDWQEWPADLRVRNFPPPCAPAVPAGYGLGVAEEGASARAI